MCNTLKVIKENIKLYHYTIIITYWNFRINKVMSWIYKPSFIGTSEASYMMYNAMLMSWFSYQHRTLFYHQCNRFYITLLVFIFFLHTFVIDYCNQLEASYIACTTSWFLLKCLHKAWYLPRTNRCGWEFGWYPLYIHIHSRPSRGIYAPSHCLSLCTTAQDKVSKGIWTNKVAHPCPKSKGQ